MYQKWRAIIEREFDDQRVNMIQNRIKLLVATEKLNCYHYTLGYVRNMAIKDVTLASSILTYHYCLTHVIDYEFKHMAEDVWKMALKFLPMIMISTANAAVQAKKTERHYKITSKSCK